MVKRTSKTRKRPLSNTAKATTRAQPSVSSKVTQGTISTYHTLIKRRAQLERRLASSQGAESDALERTLDSVSRELMRLGGIDAYQKASQLGQSSARGGDSSKVLVEWLHEAGHGRGSETSKRKGKGKGKAVDMEQSCGRLRRVSLCWLMRRLTPRRMLEIGAVSPSNYANCSTWIENHPIDVHSQHPHILQQDFFERPVPTLEAEHFDVISCSLVLNFVDDPQERGRMLSLIRRHLKQSEGSLLFLVLPLACVTNSRYLTALSLKDLMNAVGFDLVNERCKEGGKVGYWLWSWKRPGDDLEPWRRRRIINDGPKRNNFSIVLP